MDFFKNVSARVGDVAKNVGDLLLDSDSDSEADERSERTRRAGGGDDAGGGEGSGPGGPARSRAGGAAVAEGSGSDSERGEEDDGPLIPEDVWNSLRAAKDRVARAAKSTAASVARDVVAVFSAQEHGRRHHQRSPPPASEHAVQRSSRGTANAAVVSYRSFGAREPTAGATVARARNERQRGGVERAGRRGGPARFNRATSRGALEGSLSVSYSFEPQKFEPQNAPHA